MQAQVLADNHSSLGLAKEAYTCAEVAQLAAVSLRQMREWHACGLLPAARRDGSAGQSRGRPSLLLPPLAVSAAWSLKHIRRYVDGTETALGWLWLEGFDYVPKQPDELLTGFLGLRQELWERMRSEVPALHGIGEEIPAGTRRGVILDQIDEAWTRDILKSDAPEIARAKLGLMLSMLGLVTADDLAMWEEIAARDNEAGAAYRGLFEQAVRENGKFNSLPPIPAEMLDDRSLIAALPLFSFAGQEYQEINWEVIRGLWQGLCRATDAWLDDPAAAPDVPLAYAAAWRRICYRNGPAAALGSLLPIADYLQNNPD